MRPVNEELEAFARRTATDQAPQAFDADSPAPDISLPEHAAGGLLLRPALAHPANAPIRAMALQRTQQTSGNRAAQRAVGFVQTKLTVSEPGDPLEQEADQIADAAVSGPACSCGGTCEACAAGGVAQRMETGASLSGSSGGDAVLPETLGPGESLDSGIRDEMAARFGRSFDDVRVHTEAGASDAARSLDARAYTVGHNIVFGDAQFNPGTTDGQRLLAHELAHVAQQTPGEGMDAAGSPALQIRDQIGRSPSRMIQRAVTTWAGDYDTDKYELQKVAGLDSVEMELRFKPNKHVDAELIGMTQTARSAQKGGAVPASTFYTTDAEKKAFENLRIPAGDPAAGTMIDRVVSHGNPLYAADKPAAGDALSSTATVAFWGQHGWRFTDKTGTLQTQDALLKDTPGLPSGLKESSQTFETTALAVKGVQDRTYYGSVQWGWQKDAAGKVTKLPLSLVSNDVPSGTFMAAMELWNKGQTSEGVDTIDLPEVTGKYSNTPGAWLVSNPSRYESTIIGKLDKNTRMEVTDKGTAKPFNRTTDTYKWWKVTIHPTLPTCVPSTVMQTLLSDTQTK